MYTLQGVIVYLSNRMRLATTWMNEEWYNDQILSAKDRDWVSLDSRSVPIS